MERKKLRSVFRTSILAGIILMSSCQKESELGYYNLSENGDSYIEFNNYIGGMTRGSRISGMNSFIQDQDTMAVWGKQVTSIGDNDYEDIIFNNQAVRFTSSDGWTYSPKKKWNYTSQYTFYGVFPYSKNGLYTVDTSNDFMVTIPTFTTPDDPDDQTDLMISEKRSVTAGNTVNMIFHHILSNVNVIVKQGSNVSISDDINSVTILRMNFNNVKSTGTYTQTGWDENCAVGAWSAQSNDLKMDTIKNKVLSSKSDTVYKDFLMIPQQLSETTATPKDVSIDAIFRVAYKDGTTSTYVKNGIRLAGISSTNKTVINSWEPNYRYNYVLAFNPQTSPRIWDADGDGSLQIDPISGDTIEKNDDTPTGGIMKYNPDEPNVVYVLEDTDGDGTPDTWNQYPVAWEDVDGDGLLEAGIDRDGDGEIDNVDDENETQQTPDDNYSYPSDGNPNNPGGKDVILVHYDSDGDGDVDEDDDWRQIEKDPDTSVITPTKEEVDNTIEFTATVSEWEQSYSILYDISE